MAAAAGVLLLMAGMGLAVPEAVAQAAATRPSAAPPAASRAPADRAARAARAARPAAAPAASAASAASAAARAATPPAAPDFEIAPAPAWVQPLAPDASIVLPPSALQLLVADHQTRLGPRGTQRYARELRQVNEAAALAQASQLQVAFDPQYQRLTVHTLAIWRDGQRIDKLERARIKLYQRETQLERQMLDGRMTAAVLLDDVRVGDRIEWAISLLGDNPVFGGRHVELQLPQSPLGPTGLFQYRLLAPEDRALQHRAGDAELVVADRVVAGERETVFRRRAAPQLVLDPLMPPRFLVPALVQVSEFADWAAVARWAADEFRPASQGGPQVAARAAAIREQAATPARRLQLALDLVQTEVRYFGIEMGTSSHRPAPAEQVLAQRFGDCKDKVVLLVALLRELQIEAAPVLVSTAWRRGAADMLPSALAFNHVIARVQLEGRTLWVDGTRALQTGAAESRQSYGLGAGLLADAAASTLATLPDAADSLRSEVQDTLRFPRLAEPGRLESRVRLHGDLAEQARALLASRPREEFERIALGDYMRYYAGAQRDGAIEVEQDGERNAMTLVTRLTLPSHWQLSDKQQLVGPAPLISLLGAMRLPDANERVRPLLLPQQGLHRHRLAVEFGEEAFEKEAQDRYDDTNALFEVHVSREFTRRSLRIEADYRPFVDALLPAEVKTFREAAAKATPMLARPLEARPLSAEQLKQAAAEMARQREGATRQVRQGKFTPLQGAAAIGVVLQKALLDADRLTPTLRAQVLLRRGIALETLGELEPARDSYQTAVPLRSGHADVHVNLSSVALKLGREAEALAHAEDALKVEPASVWARYARAFARYAMRDFAGARDDLAEVMKTRAEVERGFAVIWLHLATRQLGGDGAAVLAAGRPTGDRPAWPQPMHQLLAGTQPFDAVLKQAAADAGARLARETELYYVAAQKSLLDGDAAAYRRQLEKVVELNNLGSRELALARRELAAPGGR